MGWAHCGLDKQGREIGYSISATCDYPGCNEKIDRGLGYVCGDMHGEDEYSCEKYFCGEHRNGSICIEDYVNKEDEPDLYDHLDCLYHHMESGSTCQECYYFNRKELIEEIRSWRSKHEEKTKD